MESLRQKKIAKQIQKDLAEIFQLNSQAWIPGVMITVTIVRMSTDLSLAKVYLSALGNMKEGDVIDEINRNKSEIRNLLGKRIRKQIKKVPEIAFFIDDSYQYAQEIEELLKK